MLRVYQIGEFTLPPDFTPHAIVFSGDRKPFTFFSSLSKLLSRFKKQRNWKIMTKSVMGKNTNSI